MTTPDFSRVALPSARRGRIYIAGPMTGYPEFNYPAFHQAAQILRDKGWHVENPASHGIVEGASWSDYLRWDLSRLVTCEAMYLLPGYEKSRGATLEFHIAQALDIKLFYTLHAISPFIEDES